MKKPDPPEIVREKIETGLSDLIGKESEFIQIIGGLYSVSFPEIDAIDPEYWKPQLHKAVQIILSALARQAPTIVCLEDLHWADPSFLELIRLLLAESRDSILFCLQLPAGYFPFFKPSDQVDGQPLPGNPSAGPFTIRVTGDDGIVAENR